MISVHVIQSSKRLKIKIQKEDNSGIGMVTLQPSGAQVLLLFTLLLALTYILIVPDNSRWLLIHQRDIPPSFFITFLLLLLALEFKLRASHLLGLSSYVSHSTSPIPLS
jgi:hypothetical protein